ncbi:transcriptional repressor TCF25-domain-containing protein [Aspergillus pseudoustus]|uniref:Transcriptional repressor TCF25-domain-containing protein n=1 Tax=Aspergillus pseudoustus TaxID=1810923 RepID=A0ABR4KZU2_9EURO
MSSRAIRKLQKLQEQESQRTQEKHHDSSEDELIARPTKPKLNAFDLLNAAGDDEDDDVNDQQSDNEVAELVAEPTKEVSATPLTDSGKKKKKAKNRKKKNAAKHEPMDSKSDDELDEIDRALKELAIHSSGDIALGTRQPTLDDCFPKKPEDLLSIEPKALNATNEMRKLFGNVVLENFDTGSSSGRRRDRARETVDLGRALTGRYSPASRGQSLGGVTQRRNILFQGKDEWPRAPSGGLGMEVVESLPSGATVYRVLHNSAYKDVQRQFELCVESMDPQRMIQLLQYNPYHISTLLQVSEIAKHQGDHAVSADLLERALFNFGRSAHSSFGNRLKEGGARLDFLHAENRELWLVGWRYIANLGMKGTWRTAYEWAKFLLSLDANDPYCIRLMIDNLALRGREWSHFIELCTQTRLSREWKYLPNIQCSLALAYLRLNKPKECREQLRVAMARYPWVFCKIAQELDIQPIPKRIWGKLPPTDGHELFTELYIVRTKDLWNTPEVVSLIVEVADTLLEGDEPIEPPEISLNIARHVVLSDIPRVTTHLPTRFVSGRISASDPLPPYDSEAFRQQSDPTPSYVQQIPEAGRPQWLRNLLDQLNNGAIHFPRFRAGGGEEAEGDEPVEEGPIEDHVLPASGPEEQVVLEQWLLGDGLHSLDAFIRQYGVDRGNWDLEIDYSPLHEYADALNVIEPSSARQRLLDGSIREALGPMVVDLLQEELEFLRVDRDE